MNSQNLKIKQTLNPSFLRLKSYLRCIAVNDAREKKFTFFRNTWLRPNNTLVVNENTKKVHQPFFSRYFYNGLGYKIFIKENTLFVWLGLTHYTLIRIPPTVRVFVKKRRFFIVGVNYRSFNDFILRLRRIRKIDVYKAKGLSEVRSYKSFIKMKSGKKKQY